MAAESGKNTGHRQRLIRPACSSVGSSSKVSSAIHTSEPIFGMSCVTTPTANPRSHTIENARPGFGRPTYVPLAADIRRSEIDGSEDRAAPLDRLCVARVARRDAVDLVE